jgi:hypothetical protein
MCSRLQIISLYKYRHDGWSLVFREYMASLIWGLCWPNGGNMDQIHLWEFAEESKEKSLLNRKISYLLRQNLGEPNFRHQLSKHFWSVSYFPIHFTRKMCFNMSFLSIWHLLNFIWQNISVDKILGEQNFRWDKIFSNKSHFRQFCPPKFSLKKYFTVKDVANFTMKKCYRNTWPSKRGKTLKLECVS